MDSSPLGRIPAKLRNYIYELSLSSPTDIKVTKLQSSDEAPCPVPMALTATCRQIRSETLAMFYSVNTFNLGRCHYHYIRTWLHSIGKVNASSIRNICVEYRWMIGWIETEEETDQRWKRYLREIEQGAPQLLTEKLRVKFEWQQFVRSARHETKRSSWIYTWANEEGWAVQSRVETDNDAS